MSAAARPDVTAFLGRFFAKPNQLTPASKPELPHWVARLDVPEPLPSVLPCWRGGKIVDWYGLAFNDRELRALGESLTAFIGPSYTTFRGQLASLDPGDPIDKAVLDLSGGNAFKFRGDDPTEIWRALERMRKVWARRGPRERETPTPVGRVLRDFYMALRAGERDVAEDTITRLRELYHVDGVNALYLRVQLLDAFRASSDLLALREVPELLRLRRPVAVTEALLRAVYHEHLVTFEVVSDPGGAAEAFRRDVLPRYSALFTARAGMQSPEAAKGFMLLAVTRVPPDRALRDEILGRTDLGGEDRTYLAALGALAGAAPPTKPEGEPLAIALKAAETSDFDRAFASALAAPPSLARTKILCECAIELGTLAAKAAAVAAVQGLPAEERESFLGRRVHRQLWESLQGEEIAGEAAAEAESVPTDWCGWLEHLDLHDGRAGSRELARRGATEWAVEAFLQSPGAVERLTGQLHGKRSQAAEVALRDSLPHLVAFFGGDPAWPNPDVRGIYRALLEILFFSTDGGRADLIVFNELLEAALALGASATEYRELVSFARELWGWFAAPLTLDWATDALELLVAHPCRDADARQSFLQAVLDRAAGFGPSLTPDQRDLLRLTASELGAGDLAGSYFPAGAAAEEEGADPIKALSGMTLAVYTLTERSAEQFRRVVEARATGVAVTLLHDRDASKRLQQHARQADLFVLVTASAKHAASYCVRATRPPEKPLLIPTGKGTASMLAVVRAYVERGN